MNINDLKNLENIEEISEEISHVPFDEMFSEREIYAKTKMHAINLYTTITIVLVIFAFGIFGGKEVYNSYKIREFQARQTLDQIEMYANMNDLQNELENIDISSLTTALDEKVKVSFLLNSDIEIEQEVKAQKVSEISMSDGSFRYISPEFKDDLYDIGKLINIATEQPGKEAGVYNTMAVHFEIRGDLIGAKSSYSSALKRAPNDPLIINNSVGFAKTIERKKKNRVPLIYTKSLSNSF